MSSYINNDDDNNNAGGGGGRRRGGGDDDYYYNNGNEHEDDHRGKMFLWDGTLPIPFVCLCFCSFLQLIFVKQNHIATERTNSFERICHFNFLFSLSVV